jgi:hypothetical protein
MQQHPLFRLPPPGELALREDLRRHEVAPHVQKLIDARYDIAEKIDFRYDIADKLDNLDINERSHLRVLDDAIAIMLPLDDFEVDQRVYAPRKKLKLRMVAPVAEAVPLEWAHVPITVTLNGPCGVCKLEAEGSPVPGYPHDAGCLAGSPVPGYPHDEDKG